MSATDRVARIKISLAEIEPVIWRLVEVPVGMSLKALHDVIQASFGWEDYHLYEFEAGDRRYGIPDPDLVRDREVRSARGVKLEALIARATRAWTTLTTSATAGGTISRSRPSLRASRAPSTRG